MKNVPGANAPARLSQNGQQPREAGRVMGIAPQRDLPVRRLFARWLRTGRAKPAERGRSAKENLEASLPVPYEWHRRSQSRPEVVRAVGWNGSGSSFHALAMTWRLRARASVSGRPIRSPCSAGMIGGAAAVPDIGECEPICAGSGMQEAGLADVPSGLSLRPWRSSSTCPWKRRRPFLARHRNCIDPGNPCRKIQGSCRYHGYARRVGVRATMEQFPTFAFTRKMRLVDMIAN